MLAASPEPWRARLMTFFPDLVRVRADLFVVGGALRDAMMGVDPFDVDLVGADVRAAAEEFARMKDARIVELGREPFTIYRVPLGDYYYDFSEQIGATLEEDLGRRDFTANAMAYSVVEDRLVDPFGGERDVRAKIVRMIAPANLDEDPLRVLRAVRIATRYGFTIEESTLAAIRARAGLLANVAAERVTYEMNAILSRTSRYHGVELMRQTGIDCVIHGAPIDDVKAATLLHASGSDPVEALAILLGGSTRDAIESFAARWRWSEATRRDVVKLVALVKCLTGGECSSAADLAILLHDAGEETARRAVVVLTGMRHERIALAMQTMIARRGREIFRMEPLLSGEEIQSIARLEPGPAVGRAKRALLEAQLRGDVTTRDEAEACVRAMRL